MKILFSKTGSAGNSSVIESSNGHLLCIDCGIKYETVNRAIGYRLHGCELLLCTHPHKDHMEYVSDFMRRGIPTMTGEETFVTLPFKGNWNRFRDKEQFESFGFKIIPLKFPHTNADGTECNCYGFLIQEKSNREKMLWVTDAQFVPYKFPQLEIYSIEANFWEQDDYIDDMDVIEKSVEQRRLRSHMSVESAVDFLKKQDLRKCKEIRLLHLSTSMTESEKARIIPYVKEQLGGDYNVVI